MNVQQMMLRNAMKMSVCEDARALRQARAYNPLAQISQFIVSALQASKAREAERSATRH